MAESEELNSFLIKVKEKNEKTGLKLNIQKTKIMALVLLLHGKQMGKKWKQWQILFSWVIKSLRTVTEATKLRRFLLGKKAYQAPPSMGFSRQECWSGLPFPSPGDLPNPGIKPRSPALQADALPSEPRGKPMTNLDSVLKTREITLPTKAHIVKAIFF